MGSSLQNGGLTAGGQVGQDAPEHRASGGPL